MSVLTELLENFDFLPNEFKRHLMLIRELDERQKSKFLNNQFYVILTLYI